MLTVHHLEASRSQRVLWLLEELAVPYELKRYARDPVTRLAPPDLKLVHPLGKSPVITDGDLVVAESGAILEYLAEQYGDRSSGDLAALVPPPGTSAQRQARFWMHYAEGSLMNWMLLKVVFMRLPKQPMPFLVRPIVRQLSHKLLAKLVDPNVRSSMAFIESHLSENTWFAGEQLSLADFQMSFPVAALLARSDPGGQALHMAAWLSRIEARPAYQRALAQGGPVIMSD